MHHVLDICNQPHTNGRVRLIADIKPHMSICAARRLALTGHCNVPLQAVHPSLLMFESITDC